MWIKSIELTNVQKHKHLFLEFHEKTNVIHGETDAGKSVVRRAFAYNGPRTTYPRHLYYNTERYALQPRRVIAPRARQPRLPLVIGALIARRAAAPRCWPRSACAPHAVVRSREDSGG